MVVGAIFHRVCASLMPTPNAAALTYTSSRKLYAAPGPPTNLALTADVVHVPAGRGWRTVEFAITPLDLVALAGTASGALMNTDVLRIFTTPPLIFRGRRRDRLP